MKANQDQDNHENIKASHEASHQSAAAEEADCQDAATTNDQAITGIAAATLTISPYIAIKTIALLLEPIYDLEKTDLDRYVSDGSYKKMDEEIIGKLKEILGEFYPNYLIIVLDETGEVQSDYTTVSVARMLMREAALEFKDDSVEVVWDDEDE